MLQTPGSLKNRDVSLTAFSPSRTGSVWGDNWRVPWHAARERAAHSATQTLAHVSACVKTTDRRRACMCLFACVTVCAYARVYQRRRVIILFFLRRNPFLLSLREHRGVMRDEPERGWRQFWGRPVLFVFSFHSSFLMPFSPSSPPSLHVKLLLCCLNNCCVWASTTRWLCQIQHGRFNCIFSFFPFLSLKLFFFCACLVEQRNCGYHKRKVYKESCVEMQKLETGGSVKKKKQFFTNRQSVNLELITCLLNARFINKLNDLKLNLSLQFKQI